MQWQFKKLQGGFTKKNLQKKNLQWEICKSGIFVKESAKRNSIDNNK